MLFCLDRFVNLLHQVWESVERRRADSGFASHGLLRYPHTNTGVERMCSFTLMQSVQSRLNGFPASFAANMSPVCARHAFYSLPQ